jgi:hypothetical protein
MLFAIHLMTICYSLAEIAKHQWDFATHSCFSVLRIIFNKDKNNIKSFFRRFSCYGSEESGSSSWLMHGATPTVSYESWLSR